MGLNLHDIELEGKNYTYLAAIDGNVAIMVEFSRNGLETRNVDLCTFRYLEMSTLGVENISGLNPDGTLKIKGNHKLESFQSIYPYKVCIGEIHARSGDIVGYIVVDRRLNYEVINKEGFKEAVRDGVIDNYTICENEYVRRMPNQMVAQFSIESGTVPSIYDTKPGINGEQLAKLLQMNGFILGYKSDIYRMVDVTREMGYWRDLYWYTPAGAVLWYSQYYGNDSKKNEAGNPFYGKATLFIDGIVDYDLMDARGISDFELGLSYQAESGHQRLTFDASENLIENYKKLLTIVKVNNPWDFTTKAINEYPVFNGLSSKLIENRLMKISCQVGKIPEGDKNSPMFLRSIWKLVATRLNIDRFNGELRSIFIDFDKNYDRMLKDAIAYETTYMKVSDKQVEEFLNAVGVKLDTPISSISKAGNMNTRNNQKKAIKMPNKSKGILGLMDMFGKK